MNNLNYCNGFVRSFDPAARVVIKDESWLMKVCAVLVWLFNRDFMNSYATTVGPNIYVPRAWLELSPPQRLLVHEVTHVKQFRWCGLGIHPWVGVPIFTLLYLLVFFPVGLAWVRYRFERHAELTAHAWEVEKLIADPVYSRERCLAFARLVAGAPYGFAWPWAVRGFEKALARAA